MTDRAFIKPAQPGTLVRKPINGYLAADGEEVTLDSYWRRRLADGDVVVAQPPATEAPKARK